jgi:lipoic acid synthetase
MTDSPLKPIHVKRPRAKAMKNVEVGEKLRGFDKVTRIPLKMLDEQEILRKPKWIRVRIPATPKIQEIKDKLKKHKLHTVCEEANCPNLGECFGGGTATFMIMGDVCTRRCSFCDVAHGKPKPLDKNEPINLAKAIADMALKYVVITSVDRDDLDDGGAQHFVECIKEARALTPQLEIEVLVPDFKGRMSAALKILSTHVPDVFNHNIETVPRLYKHARPGSDYQGSLDLLKAFKLQVPKTLTKSGLMLGMGETIEEIVDVLKDLRAHDVDMITLGQYLQPSKNHYPVTRYVTPEEFEKLAEIAKELGFLRVASGPLVRSSYHADEQMLGHTTVQ